MKQSWVELSNIQVGEAICVAMGKIEAQRVGFPIAGCALGAFGVVDVTQVELPMVFFGHVR